MTDRKNFFDQVVKNDLRTYDNHYFRDFYKMVAIDSSKQQALDADPNTTN